MKVLFICKKRIDSYGKSYGLINSADFVANMLKDNDIDAKMVDVVDNNCIDREVHLYKPTHVVIEALWVVPSKVHTLIKLHPKITWIVRVHSKIPFLANEGNAIEWIGDYTKISNNHNNFYISFNSKETTNEFKDIYQDNILYLPNVYNPTYSSSSTQRRKKPLIKDNSFIDIGCFGAIRPLKNQLIQAFAALNFAKQIGKNIRFHINATREEQRGDSVTKNIIALFRDFPQHKLIGHQWMTHWDFVDLVKQMDLGLQVSYTESFNIVAADFVWSGVPIVVSDEIGFISSWYYADCNSVEDIKNHMLFAWKTKAIGLHYLNKRNLNNFNKEAMDIWLKTLETC